MIALYLISTLKLLRVKVGMLLCVAIPH